MKIETEKMMEAFANSGWEYNETTHEMVQENLDKTRRFSYLHSSDGDKSSTILTLGLCEEIGSISNVFTLIIYEKGEEVSVKISIDVINDLFEFGKYVTEVTYDNILGQWRSGYSVGQDPHNTETRRIKDDRKELLYTLTKLPKDLDLEETANLFIKQMVIGEMTRPVLVAKK